MSLKSPSPGLNPIGGKNMRLRYDSKRPFKGQIIVEGGAEVDVPADVADQLRASDTHWHEAGESSDLTCSVCGFTAKSKGGLTAHERTHEED